MAGLVAIVCEPRTTGAALQAVWAAGDAALLLPHGAPRATVDRLLADMRPTALLEPVPGGIPRQVPLEAGEPVADDVALVVATSGSTGGPKGVELTHAALRASTTASLARLGCRPGERWALALPTHHVAGVQVLLRSWALGTEAEVIDHLDDLAACTAEHVSLVPTQLARLLESGSDLTRFRTVLLGGARAEPVLVERARRTGVTVVTSYGMTETCGGCVYDGHPLAGVEVALDEGRIRLRGPVLMRGYRLAHASSTVVDDAGWFTTNDRGRLGDGRLEVLGRIDDVIVSGGENVPLAVVEAALRELPTIADVAAVGVHDEEWGESVVAVVAAADPRQPPTLATVREHVKASHPAAFAPRRLVVVEALPRDGMGKLTRDAVRRLVDAPAAADSGSQSSA